MGEEKKEIRISLSTVLLFIAIFIILVMGMCIYKLNNKIASINKDLDQIQNSEMDISSNLETNKREYFIERQIMWTPNTTSYDFDTKRWLPNDSAVYYIATDVNNHLCIINERKELVHKTDIVINKLVTSAYCAEWEKTLTVILEDQTAYDINIMTFEYTQYTYTDGY